jgi:hypothetical protein
MPNTFSLPSYQSTGSPPSQPNPQASTPPVDPMSQPGTPLTPSRPSPRAGARTSSPSPRSGTPLSRPQTPSTELASGPSKAVSVLPVPGPGDPTPVLPAGAGALREGAVTKKRSRAALRRAMLTLVGISNALICLDSSILNAFFPVLARGDLLRASYLLLGIILAAHPIAEVGCKPRPPHSSCMQHRVTVCTISGEGQ